ncbi:MAG: S41 family peptidase [Bacteroidales bacterium]
MKLIRKFRLKTRTTLIMLTLAGASLLLMSAGSKNFELAKNLDIFNSLFRELVIHYVDDINPSDLIKTGVDEMLYNLDPYTNYIPESEIEDMRFMTTGQYGGIGAVILSREGYTIIAEPYEGFPAQKAGLLPGDKILSINDEPVASFSSDEVSQLLKGQPGTPLSITIEREGEQEPLVKSLEREVVQVNNIPYYGMADETTGYIRLNGFTQNAGREVREAFIDLRSNNQLEGLIIDLRGNGGGLLHEAVNIVNLFVPKNELVVSTRGKIEERNSTHKTLNDPLDTEIPLIVMVNSGSASASEIVAGAIQDLDRGVILGQRTFGKGLVQNVVNLSYNTQLKVTVAKYYIPSGRCIQAIDYAKRNEDGSVAAIPDSLKVAHKTRNGRVVYDGGGIEPDFSVPAPNPANVTRALYGQLMIFDYANDFYRRNPSISSAQEFTVTDEIYQDFVSFVNKKDFDYLTLSEKLLMDLKKASSEEKYFAAIEEDYEELRQSMMHNKDEDLITFRNEIEELLKEEIVSRYYHQKGRVMAALVDDPDLSRALELFAHDQQYQTLLAGSQQK